LEIELPDKLKSLRHDDIVEAILELNPGFEKASKSSWAASIPDLEHPLKRIAVEIELTSLSSAWSQCLEFYREGATEIHLILAPKLYQTYQGKEEVFVRENPIPNVIVHSLKAVEKIPKETEKPEKKPSRKKVKRLTVYERMIKEERVKEKFTIVEPPKIRKRKVILRKNGTPVKADFKGSDIGLESEIYFVVDKKRGKRKLCNLCGEPAIVRTIYQNIFGEQVIMLKCNYCGFLEMERF